MNETKTESQTVIKNKAKSPKMVTFTFGRFSPPSAKHEGLISKVKEISGEDGDHFVFASPLKDNLKNTLDHDKKIEYLSKMFPGINVHKDPKIENVFHALKHLQEKGYGHIKMVVPDSKKDKIQQSLNPYIKGFNFSKFEMVGSPDEPEINKVSSDELMYHVAKDNFDDFHSLMPKKFSKDESRKMFNHMKQGLIPDDKKTIKESKITCNEEELNEEFPNLMNMLNKNVLESHIPEISKFLEISQKGDFEANTENYIKYLQIVEKSIVVVTRNQDVFDNLFEQLKQIQ